MDYFILAWLFFAAAYSWAAGPSTKAQAPLAQTKAGLKQQSNPGQDLIRTADAIQKQYEKTKSATFDFEQSYQHPFLPMNEKSKGKVFFKAKNMLWQYNEPENRKKEFYIQGKKFTYHLVSDKQAFFHNCFEKDTLSASITFLWGQGQLRQSFELKPYEKANANKNLAWIYLVPKEPNAPVKGIALGVDPKTYIVKESAVTDLSDGINNFIFSNFKTNPNILDQTFVFKPQAGVKVQPMPNVQCPADKVIPKAAVPAIKPNKETSTQKQSAPKKPTNEIKSPSPKAQPKPE